ncbi:MAG: glycosyltransferase family 2 protein, partial [PVC group bacterium]
MEHLHGFSVIVPCHNAARTLDKCLRALLNSNYPSELFEVIVSDDISTDNSLEIARAQNVRVVETDQKTGPAGARNRGAEAAANEYLIFIDSDVIASPDTLRQFNEAINRYPDYCVI